MNIAGSIAAPALKGEDHRLGPAFPEQRARPHSAARHLGGPLGPANALVPSFEALIASITALSLATQRNRVGQLPLLQQQQRVAAVEGAVERDTSDFQAFLGDLIEEDTDDLVGLGLG